METSAFEQILAGVNIGTVTAAIIPILLLVIGIKMAFKGTDVAGRVVRKV